jgi:protein O-GlcNAc transferase
LITRSLDEYHSLALRLASDAAYLGVLRSRLAANRETSRLVDARQFARSLEKAYVTMWEIHASGEKPRAFTVSPT